jgi:hypothetical protein
VQTSKWISVTLVSLLLAVSCGGSEAEDEGVDCAAVGKHLSELCGQPLGEAARSDCEVFGLAEATTDCLMQLTECHAAQINGQCGLVDVVKACSADSDCPEPLLCSERFAGCAECDTDTDCTAPQECGGGACFERKP